MFVVLRRPIARAALLALAVIGALLVSAQPSTAAERIVRVGAGGDDEIRVPSTVEQGDTVIFRWEDGGHDLSMGGPGGESAVIGENDDGFQFRRVLNRPGPYALVCQEHDDDGMNATFTVSPVAGGPDPDELPPPARDVVVGPDGDDGQVDPATVNLFQGAELLFHFAESDTISLGDGRTASGSAGDTVAFVMDEIGSFSYSTGSDSGTAIVSENTGLGVRPAPEGSTPAATIQVGSGTSYSPADVTIDEGQVVEWNWAGGTHNVQFDDGTGSPFQSSGTWSAKFYTPSATPLRFQCTAHPGMEGTVTVTDTGAPGPNEEAPAPDPAEEPGGGGDGGPGPDPSTIAAEVTGGQGGNVFTPATVSIQTGQSVRWTWTGVHNVTFEDGVASNTVPDGTLTRRFFNPGTYNYVCTLHPGMNGSVQVTGDPVPDDGNGVSGGTGGGGGDGGGGDGGSGGGGGDDGTDTVVGRAAAVSTSVANAAATAPRNAPGDQTRPRLRVLRARLRRGRRVNRLRLRVDEDALLLVSLRALGRSRDVTRTRSFRLFARAGRRTLRLPRMRLTARRYRLRIVAVDQSGNRSAAQTAVLRLRRR